MRKFFVLFLVLLFSCSPEEKVECITVAPAKMADFFEAYTGPGEPTPLEGYAVRSDDFVRIYFFTVRWSDSVEDEEHIGVWTSNRLEPSDGIIMAVNWTSTDYTNWPSAAVSDAQVTTDTHGFKQSLQCMSHAEGE